MYQEPSMFLGPQASPQGEFQISHSQNGQSITTLFDSLSFNVEPFVLYRPLSSFTRWLIIVCVPTSHPQYKRLQSTIEEYTSSIDSGVSTTISLKDNSYKDCKTISKHKWYSVDLREKYDSQLKNRITIAFPEGVQDWYTSLYIDKIYNKCKGLVIYADKLEQIPKPVITRSIIGLCNLSGEELRKFLFEGCAKRIDHVNPINETSRIVGYSNYNKWTKWIELN